MSSIRQEPDWFPLDTTLIAGHQVVVCGRKVLAEAMAHDCKAIRERQRLKSPWRPRVVFDINGQGVSLFWSDQSYRSAVEQADIIHADGGFVVASSRLTPGPKIEERTATTDVFHDFARRAEQDGLSFYIFGGTEDVNRRCADIMVEQYPRLNIVGRRNGYFKDDEIDGIIDEINARHPDVLWVGLGKPREQVFCTTHGSRIKAGWVVTCGGCFNFVTGDYSRAPKWMQGLNIEWIHRAFSEPRLFWRYLTTSPHAIYVVAKEDFLGQWLRGLFSGNRTNSS